MGRIDTSQLRTKADLALAALEQLTRTFEHAIQSRMDEVARGRGYDSIATAVSYADEPAVERFQIEGKALRGWRSLVWSHCYEVLEDVKQGRRAVPTVQALIKELPTLDWSTEAVPA